MLGYNAFNGGISPDEAASGILSALGGLVPASKAGALANALIADINMIVNAQDGFQWTDLGSAIADLASLILQFTPAGEYANIVSLLWTLSGTL